MSLTNNHIKEQNYKDDEISLKEVILKLREWNRYLLSKWNLILFAGILGGLIGFIYAYSKKPVYTAECTFVLQEGGAGGGLGQYAGIASMVGIDIGGGGTNGIFEGDNIIELYKSRSMIQKTLLSPADFDGQKELLVDRFIQANKLYEKWKDDLKLRELSFTIPEENFTRQHDSILGSIVKEINKNYLTVEKPDKKLSIISVRVRAKDELFAKAFTDKIVENVNDFYIQTKTKKSTQNLSILQKQADSVKAVLNASITGAASTIDANPNANAALQILRVPSQRKQIDVQANSAMYAEIVKNLEIAKISLRKEMPLIQVVDKPVLPLDKERFGKLKGLILGGFIAAFFTVCLLLSQKVLKDILKS
ncbi:lipopolysaccharide biosynthesis protein [Rubrolithibacter danxiaensis]|uniref:lipopolysaccharide biosynthesis protein n=1 Tax=Rubrolithibacter danxiaensis TaxID=3390805 RepID=UPI003BF87FFF